MRKALLVIALLAASFAGGLAANSPAAAKLKTLLGLSAAAPAADEIPPDATDPADPFPAAPPPWAAPAVEPAADPAPSPQPTPTPAPAPAPVADPAVTAAATAPAGSAAPTAPPEPAADVPAPPAPTAPGSTLPRLEPTPTAPATAPPPAAPQPQPQTPPAAAPAPAPQPPATQPAAEPAAKPTDATPEWADAPDSTAPAAAVVPGRPVATPPAARSIRVDPAVTPTAAPSSSAAAAATGWPELRRRMKELGVTRYRLEAEPDGTARFSCVIPLAGERAVAQHFEAEADDELKAADAALRRIALWRAAQRR